MLNSTDFKPFQYSIDFDKPKSIFPNYQIISEDTIKDKYINPHLNRWEYGPFYGGRERVYQRPNGTKFTVKEIVRPNHKKLLIKNESHSATHGWVTSTQSQYQDSYYYRCHEKPSGYLGHNFSRKLENYSLVPDTGRKFARKGIKAKLEMLAMKIGTKESGVERQFLRRIGGFLFDMAQRIK